MKFQAVLEGARLGLGRKSPERDASVADIPLGQLLSLAEPRGGIQRAIRNAQISALIRLVPAILGCLLLTGLVVATALADSVPARWLVLWCGAMAALCLSRGFRALRLRFDRDYADRRPPSARTIVVIAGILSALWLVPPLLFFPMADASDKLLMIAITIGLLSAGSFTMATVPLAALLFMTVLAAGAFGMSLRLDEPFLAALMPVYALIM